MTTTLPTAIPGVVIHKVGGSSVSVSAAALPPD